MPEFKNLYLHKLTEILPHTAVLAKSYHDYIRYLDKIETATGRSRYDLPKDLIFIQEPPAGKMFEQIVLIEGWEEKRYNIELLVEAIIPRLGALNPDIEFPIQMILYKYRSALPLIGIRREEIDEFLRILPPYKSECDFCRGNGEVNIYNRLNPNVTIGLQKTIITTETIPCPKCNGMKELPIEIPPRPFLREHL